MKFDIGSMPSNLVVGARYEQTDVHSVNSQLVPTALLWQDDNDFQVVRPTVPTLVTGDGSYNNLLPNLDFDIGLSDSLKARFSYSKTIARAGYGTLTAGQNAGTPGGSTINGFLPNGNQNNPGILPLESDNFDISVEYYFSDTGYVSLGAFQKNVENFIGNSVEQINLFGITQPDGWPVRSGRRSCVRLQRERLTPADRRLRAVHGDGDVAQPGHVHGRERHLDRRPGELQRHERAARGVRDEVRHPADGERSAVHVQRQHAGQQPGSQDPWLRVRWSVLLRRDWIWRPRQLHDRRWRHRLST